jgi:hypothetical protein
MNARARSQHRRRDPGRSRAGSPRSTIRRGYPGQPPGAGPILTDNRCRAGAQDQPTVASATPIRRIGQPEVAAAAVWLCPDAGGPRPGSSLVIDGGKLGAPPPFAHKLRRG